MVFPALALLCGGTAVEANERRTQRHPYENVQRHAGRGFIIHQKDHVRTTTLLIPPATSHRNRFRAAGALAILDSACVCVRDAKYSGRWDRELIPSRVIVVAW